MIKLFQQEDCVFVCVCMQVGCLWSAIAPTIHSCLELGPSTVVNILVCQKSSLNRFPSSGFMVVLTCNIVMLPIMFHNYNSMKRT